ncbi:MAG: COMM domain-containing protein [Planctomycetota bacterium]
MTSTRSKGGGGGPQLRLHACAGNPPPPTILGGWDTFLALPSAARADFLALLDHGIRQPLDPSYQGALRQLCQAHALDEAATLAALHACEYLLRQASGLNIDRNALRQDLGALSGNDFSAAGAILERFDTFRPEFRRAIFQESLADHGKVLVGLDWRVDNLVNSDRGSQLHASVVFLTLRYRDGDRVDRISLQLTPEALQELRRFTERFREE